MPGHNRCMPSATKFHISTNRAENHDIMCPANAIGIMKAASLFPAGRSGCQYKQTGSKSKPHGPPRTPRADSAHLLYIVKTSWSCKDDTGVLSQGDGIAELDG